MRKTSLDFTNFPQAFADIRSDYDAAHNSRFRRELKGLAPLGSGADFHVRNERDIYYIMELARYLDRNDPFGGVLVNTAVRNTLQDGMDPDPQTGRDDVNTALTEMWWEWSEDPYQVDIAGKHDFRKFTSLALRHWLVDGDSVFLALEGGRLQHIEGHRIRTPNRTKKNVFCGILRDQYGRPLECWVTKKDDMYNRYGSLLVDDVECYPFLDKEGNLQVFHVYDATRSSQTRGVSAFAPVFDVTLMVGDVRFATLVQAQAVSSYVLIRTRMLEGVPLDASRPNSETSQNEDGSTLSLESIGPGMIFEGAPGETLNGFSPNIPNPEHIPYIKSLLQQISINLGVPMCVVLLDGSETNFSGFRGAIDQAKIGWRQNQETLMRTFLRPVYRWKVREFIRKSPFLRDLLKSGTLTESKLLNHYWKRPRMPYIEPQKDANTDKIRLENNLTSPRRVFGERGEDFDDVAKEIIEDKARIITLAIKKERELNKEFPGAEVHWRDLTGMKPVVVKPLETESKGSKPGNGEDKDAA
jgi:lambda family phage portal protein